MGVEALISIVSPEFVSPEFLLSPEFLISIVSPEFLIVIIVIFVFYYIRPGPYIFRNRLCKVDFDLMVILI